ncbi:MAG: metal ABC transporter ATP-binding protein [Chloroflexi bacterium]|nr:metal ABC transporter ATP-binding protein [Chloroflexota bacterium]
MYPHIKHETDQPILNVHHLNVRFSGHNALEDVTFHLHEGERVAVVGPNGAGKSTLFKIIAGVLSPSSGEVKIFGSYSHEHICIAYIPQRNQIDWRFPVNVGDVVMMGRSAKMKPFSLPGKNNWEIVYHALETVGMRDLATRQISQLSGGQQQRMFIARALAQEAELMLMDEPLAGLDDPAQENLLNLLKELQKEKVTIMVATHDLNQAATHFDRILLLNRKLIQFGSSQDVLSVENLKIAYGGRLKVLDEKNAYLALDHSCCEGREES